jgi:hypothetical protein
LCFFELNDLSTGFAVSLPLQIAALAGSCSFPFPKGAKKRVGILVAEKAGRFAELQQRL